MASSSIAVGVVGGTELTRDLPSNLSLFFETLRDLHLPLLHFDVNAKPMLTCVATTDKDTTVCCDFGLKFYNPRALNADPTIQRPNFSTQTSSTAHAPTSHSHKMSSPYHTDGSASGMTFQGICYVSLTLIGGFVELLGTPIAALCGLFGINTPWDDRHPWIKPEKHCQDFRPWFPIHANFVVKALICFAAAFLCLLVGFTLAVSHRRRNAQREYELRVLELCAPELRALERYEEKHEAEMKRLKKEIADAKRQTARNLRAIEAYERKISDCNKGIDAKKRESALRKGMVDGR
jgi:hypothetical protein